MSSVFKSVLRLCCFPVDASEDVRKKVGGRIFLTVTAILVVMFFIDAPLWLFVTTQLIWGAGMYISISLAFNKPAR